MNHSKDSVSCFCLKAACRLALPAVAFVISTGSAITAAHADSYVDDPYTSACWKGTLNGNGYTSVRSARANFIDHHDWQDNFNLKFSDDWVSDTADSPDYPFVFNQDVKGGLSIKAAPPNTSVGDLAREVESQCRSRVRSEGGRVTGISVYPVRWANMNARRINQRYSFPGVPPVTCVTLVAEKNGKEYKLELAQFDRLYNSRDYRPMIETCIASLRLAR